MNATQVFGADTAAKETPHATKGCWSWFSCSGNTQPGSQPEHSYLCH